MQPILSAFVRDASVIEADQEIEIPSRVSPLLRVPRGETMSLRHEAWPKFGDFLLGFLGALLPKDALAFRVVAFAQILAAVLAIKTHVHFADSPSL
jgi:hypothetical protein